MADAHSAPRRPQGGLRIDVETREADRDGRRLKLTPKEFDLLAFLAAEPGRAFTRAQLLEEVWGSSSEWQAAATVTEHIHRLRAKLEGGRDRTELVFTVKGVGYRFASGARDADAARGAVLDHDAILVVVDGRICTATAAAREMLSPAFPFAVLGREFGAFIAASSSGALGARISDGAWPRPELISIACDDGSVVRVEMASMPVKWSGQPATQVMLWADARSSGGLD